MKADKLPASLLEAHEYAQQTIRRLEQLKEFETREYERLEVEYLRRNYAEKNTRPLRSVLAEMYRRPVEESFVHKVVTPRTVPSRPQRQTFEPPKGRNTQEESSPASQDKRELVTMNPGTAPNTRDHAERQNQRPSNERFRIQDQLNRPNPPRHLSRHPVINGSEVYKRDMGDLCFRCGDLGHRRPDCRSRPMETWEQEYLKETIFQGLKSNFVGFRGNLGGLRYRDIENSNWRGRSEENTENRERQTPAMPSRQPRNNPEQHQSSSREEDGIPLLT
ncbi:hypothetical protein K3495_g16382, partial [Podosphaera aphanis]